MMTYDVVGQTIPEKLFHLDQGFRLLPYFLFLAFNCSILFFCIYMSTPAEFRVHVSHAHTENHLLYEIE